MERTGTIEPESAPRGPRERALERGTDALSDAELLAIVLGAGVPGVPVGAMASALLERFGGLARLARLGPSALAIAPGLGTAKALRLLAALELGRRAHSLATRAREPLGDSAAVARWCAARFGAIEHEELWVLSLDGRNGLRGARRVAQGGLHGCAVRPRDVLRAALADAAVSVVLAHNHPSGDPTPSSEDLALTHAVADACDVVGIPLVDHVVLSPQGAYVSLLDLGAIRA
jgi:DNA repair protein RadC